MTNSLAPSIQLDRDGNVIAIMEFQCPATGQHHFKMMDRVVTPWESVWEQCERCGHWITIHGHRWATVTYIIKEQECIEDLL